MDQLDMPEAYDGLSPSEKEALAYWIDQVMGAAAKYSTRSSYGIKHDFEREGFYLTNGQFKGAMLTAGYQPQNTKELNWTFKIKPVQVSGSRRDPEKFAIGTNNQQYMELLARVKAEHRAQSEAREQAKQGG